VTGYGGADKRQVQLMVQRLLGLSKVPKPDDVADALAVAITGGEIFDFGGQCMIVELRGTLAQRQGGYCVVDVNGVGYGIEISRDTENSLGDIGESVHLYTHLIVREDGWRLVGFNTSQERQCFVDMLSVNGVGVKGALALLNHLGLEGVVSSVQDGRWQN